MIENDVQIELRGKTVLVTGGSMGIGYAAAEACLAAQARVAICARDRDGVATAVGTLQKGLDDSIVFGSVADVSLPTDVDRLFSEVSQQFGQVDGVIHSAGVYGPIGKITDVDDARWLDVLRINLYGSFLVLKRACIAMRSRGGRIVLLAGGGAATPFPNYTGYACSKVGIVRLVETTAQEMKTASIEINALAPGFVATRLHQQTLEAGLQRDDSFYEKTKAMLETGSVPASVGGRAAAFLVSDAASGITGKFVAAPYDGWANWPSHLDELLDSDLFTLRRILPKERGQDWQ